MSVRSTGGADISSQIIICLFCMRISCDILSFKYVLPDTRRIDNLWMLFGVSADTPILQTTSMNYQFTPLSKIILKMKQKVGVSIWGKGRVHPPPGWQKDWLSENLIRGSKYNQVAHLYWSLFKTAKSMCLQCLSVCASLIVCTSNALQWRSICTTSVLKGRLQKPLSWKMSVRGYLPPLTSQPFNADIS